MDELIQALSMMVLAVSLGLAGLVTMALARLLGSMNPANRGESADQSPAEGAGEREEGGGVEPRLDDRLVRDMLWDAWRLGKIRLRHEKCRGRVVLGYRQILCDDGKGHVRVVDEW